ncbi:hypothetical protein HYH03_003616 [Edaphochlamys debaryana]|uniref:Uncharacterized protein n=1 Tax=Edaphochlamys debaryana TaxID=47281 RepID=A0A836C429_9CHLO|nr:hypothetical protein HYH03_003616 [Edaphochlamys debaryana]|eukprot:KAG2498357.1 hypothetical protein HYH03_003616 [Edaphochlamys debaryana]
MSCCSRASAAPNAPGVGHGLLYIIASLVLGIELNLLGPTVASIAQQLSTSEAALGPVVGLGGIGLLVGGIPAGWLLDRLPGHLVFATALALQAAAFGLLPHLTQLNLLAGVYCSAALTFNVITTGANAMILWRYPIAHGTWLNLASALFGVGCFCAPMLARAAAPSPQGPAGPDAALGYAAEGVSGPPFSLRGGDAAWAYYAVALGAALCAVWALMLPSPPLPGEHSGPHQESPSEPLDLDQLASLQPSTTNQHNRRQLKTNKNRRHRRHNRHSQAHALKRPDGAGAGAAAQSEGGAGAGAEGYSSDGSGSLCRSPSFSGGITTTGSVPAGFASEASGGFGSTLSESSLAMSCDSAGGLRGSVGGASEAGHPHTHHSADVLAAAAAQVKAQARLHQHQHRILVLNQQQQQRLAAAAGGSGGAAANGRRTAGGGLWRRYTHELSMGWPVLAPVVLLLFANISTQASFGAWVTTYCRRAVGLDEAAAQAVTAAYWAAFTGTRLVGAAAAPWMHASSVLLSTCPFALLGAGLAVLGPQVPGLLPTPDVAPGAAAPFAAALPLWALYLAVSGVGVGCATGFANSVSLTGDHLQLDGFTNGILSSVAGLASTLCPAAVPWLAEHTGLGYGALMGTAFGMSALQLVSVLAAMLGARYVDAWIRAEEAEEDVAELAAALVAERARRARLEGLEGRAGEGERKGGREGRAARRAGDAVVVVVAGGSEEGSEEGAEEAGPAEGGRRQAGRRNAGGELGQPLLDDRRS